MNEKIYDDLERTLKSDIDFVKKVEILSSTIKTLVDADRCTIFIHDSLSHSFWSAYIEGISFIEIPDTKGIVSEVFSSDKCLVVNDVQNHPNFYKNIDIKSNYMTTTMLTSAIKDEFDSVVGVIQILNKKDNQLFQNSDLLILEKILNMSKKYMSNFKK